MIVSFYNNLKRKLLIDEKYTKKIIELSAKYLKIKNQQLSVLLVGDQRIKSLNKKFRKKDKATDVLSFNSEEKGYLGEIIINYNKVLSQAKKYKNTVKQEYALLLIHGFLHLLGYDHEKDSDYKKMKAKEDIIFKKIYGKN